MEITHHLGTVSRLNTWKPVYPAGLGVSYKLGSLGVTGCVLVIVLIWCSESAAFPRPANVCCLSERLEMLF